MTRTDAPYRPPAVIVAGGLGRRMGGRDKPFVPVGGRTLLARTVDRLAPQVAGLAINANGDPLRFAEFGLPVLPDTMAGPLAGPLAGILAGMHWAQASVPGACVIASAATDTPFLPDDLIRRLSAVRAVDEETIALAASSGGIHPLFGLWPVALAGAIEIFLQGGDRKVLRFVEGHRRIIVRFDDTRLPDGSGFDPFININTPDDIERAEAIATAIGSRCE